MAVTEAEWVVARRVVRSTIRSSMHCAIASSNPDGTTHVTPIGSIILTDVGRGFYFDIFNRGLARNLDADPRVTILAVDTGRTLWLRSLLKGRFVRPPALRLVGEVGPARAGTQDEADRFRRVVGPMLRTRGGQLLWGHLDRVRDIRIDEVAPLQLGAMDGRLGPHSG